MAKESSEEKFIHVGICPSELMDIACRMAEDIQEYIDEGEKGGSNMSSSKELLEDFNQLYMKSNRSWQNIMAYGNASGLEALLDQPDVPTPVGALEQEGSFNEY